MPRKALGIRLWLRPERRDSSGSVIESSRWIIKDSGRQISTGCKERERIDAEAKLHQYIEANGTEPKRQNFIYFVTAECPDFPIKIGITNNRFCRFASLQTGLPYDLRVMGFLPAKDQTSETVLHRKFAHLRLRGEWFTRTPELLEFIERLELLTEEAA